MARQKIITRERLVEIIDSLGLDAKVEDISKVTIDPDGVHVTEFVRFPSGGRVVADGGFAKLTSTLLLVGSEK